MGTWTNDDGLHIRLGRSEADMKKVGSYVDYAEGNQVLEVQLDFGDFTAVGTETILSDTVRVPSGAFLEKAEFVVDTAFAGATATLDLGLIDEDRTTAWDQDGIDVAIAVGSLTAGAVISCDGALVGTILSNSVPGLITATNDTAAFTAGRGYLRLHLRHL